MPKFCCFLWQVLDMQMTWGDGQVTTMHSLGLDSVAA